MKKLFGSLWIALWFLAFVTLLTACKPSDNKIERMDMREELLEIIEFFGPVQEENFEPGDDEGIMVGTAAAIMAFEDDSINLLYIEGDVGVVIEMVLSTGTRNTILIWNVMITFVDIKNGTYLYLDFYLDNWEDYVVRERFDNFIERLTVLEIEDILWVLEELGYDEVKHSVDLLLAQSSKRWYWE